MDIKMCCVAMLSVLGALTARSWAQTANTRGFASHCNYLAHSKSQWQTNAAPFKIYTRARKNTITSGTPVEITVGPVSPNLNFFNFSDFIVYATPAVQANMEFEIWGGARPSSPHLGVFQLFPQWSAGSGGMSCNSRSRTEDSVGAFEDRLLTIFKRYYPNNQMLARYRPPARNQVSVLWWPTKEALQYPEIKFVANMKVMGNWFKIQSTTWKVNRPVDQWAMTERMLSRYQAMQGNLRAMERKLDQPV